MYPDLRIEKKTCLDTESKVLQKPLENEEKGQHNRLINKEIDKFIKTNRRLTLNICNKIIADNDDCYYCGIAQIPGIWLASSIRESKKNKIINIKNIKDEIYNRQEHLVESCSRQLLRSESSKFLGNCRYSITYYKSKKANRDLVRISIPIRKFLICTNITENALERSFNNEISLIEILKKELQQIFANLNTNNDTTLENIWKFITGIHEEENVDNSNKRKFQEICKSHKEIRWAVITTGVGRPLCRFKRTDVDMYIKGPDELENIVETCFRQIARKNISKFFGPVKFTISVYEKELMKLTIPIYEESQKNSEFEYLNGSKETIPKIKHLVILTLDPFSVDPREKMIQGMGTKEIQKEKPIDKIIDFIEKIDKNTLEISVTI